MVMTLTVVCLQRHLMDYITSHGQHLLQEVNNSAHDWL
jgi:hypothetical protein